MKYSNKAFGKRLASLREKYDISQESLARVTGTTQQSLSRYEKGTRQAPIEFVIKVAEVFKVSTDYLLCQSDTKTTDTNEKAVCDYIGLTDSSVRNIRFLTTACETYARSLDILLRQIKFQTLQASHELVTTKAVYNCMLKRAFKFAYDAKIYDVSDKEIELYGIEAFRKYPLLYDDVLEYFGSICIAADETETASKLRLSGLSFLRDGAALPRYRLTREIDKIIERICDLEFIDMEKVQITADALFYEAKNKMQELAEKQETIEKEVLGNGKHNPSEE